MNTLPKYDQIMLPILRMFSDGQTHHRFDFLEDLQNHFESEKLSGEEMKVFKNRIAWALTFLKNAKVLETPKRGYYQITDRGRELLAGSPSGLTGGYLKDKYPDLMHSSFYNPAKRGESKATTEEISKSSSTPEELISQATSEIEAETQSQILDEIQKLSYPAFEVLVVKLLVAMGYGKEEFSTNTSYTNDGGIDGIIQADKLGFDRIYVQAKKHTGNIGRPDIQKFVGAMTGTQKGVFITTSDFAKSVEEYISTRPESIMLINGQELVELMHKYNQGVSVKTTVEIKSLDSDFWEELI